MGQGKSDIFLLYKGEDYETSTRVLIARVNTGVFSLRLSISKWP